MEISDITAELEHGSTQYSTRDLSIIQRLVIHHTATPPTTTPRTIAHYHVATRNWPGIAYHYLIRQDGIVYQTNSIETVSYHVRQFNTDSIGIALIGDFTTQAPPPLQLTATSELIQHLRATLERPLSVVGHRDLLRTQCPGNTWPDWRLV